MIGFSLEKPKHMCQEMCTCWFVMVYVMTVIAANYADMHAEAVEFRNIGCG